MTEPEAEAGENRAKAPWAVTWLELFLFAMLVVAGLAVHEETQRWMMVESQAAGELEASTNEARLAWLRERFAQVETERKSFRDRRVALELAILEDTTLREELRDLPLFVFPYDGDGSDTERASSIADLEARLRTRGKFLELLDRRLFGLIGEERLLEQQVRRAEEAIRSGKKRTRLRETWKLLALTGSTVTLLFLLVRLLVFLAAPRRSPIRFLRIALPAAVTIAIVVALELSKARFVVLTALLVLSIPFLVRLAARSTS
jgi:hypothetical protein